MEPTSRLRSWGSQRVDGGSTGSGGVPNGAPSLTYRPRLRAGGRTSVPAQPPAPLSHLRHGRPHRIRGWALVRWAGARLAQRRYLRLMHYALTVFDGADEHVDLVMLEQVLVGTRVHSNAKKLEIVVRTPDKDKIVVTVRTVKEFDAWRVGFADAAREPDNYYTTVQSRKLGAGAFSEVFFGFDRDNGDHAAIKVVDKGQCTRAMAEHAETEARIMAYVQHPSIIACRDIFDGPDTLHVVMEFMPGGTLEDRVLQIIRERGAIPEHLAATVLERLLSALVYLESEGICHRDVKPDNILIGSTKSTADKDAWAATVCLSDFGLAAFVKAPGGASLTGFVGTPHYVAPEVLARAADNSLNSYGCAVDVWAAGVIAYWMLSGGSMPFDGLDSAKICRCIRDGAPLAMEGATWDAVSAHGKSFVRSLLQPCPHVRLTAAASLTHPWMLRSRGEKREALAASSASAFAISRAAAGPPRISAGNVFRRRRLSVRSMLRTAVHAVRAANRLSRAVLNVPLVRGVSELLNDVHISSSKSYPELTSSRARVSKPKELTYVGSLKRPMSKLAASERMVPAPERAPVGTDGLGYNVGLFRSFAPKQRLRAGTIEQPTTAPLKSGYPTEANQTFIRRAPSPNVTSESTPSSLAIQRAVSSRTKSLNSSRSQRQRVHRT